MQSFRFGVSMLILCFVVGCGGDSGSGTTNSSANPDDADAVKALESLATELKKDGEGFVTEVNFRGATIDDSALGHLVGLRRVRSVLLNETTITDDGLVAVGKTTTLRNVDLRDCKVSNAGIAHLTGLTDLAALRLSGKSGAATVDDDALTDIAKLTKLRALALDFLWVSEEGLSKLGDLKILEELYLAKTLVGDDAMGTLQQFPKLKKLRVAQTQVSNEGLAQLTVLTQLEDLDISECSLVSDDGLQHIGKMTQLKRLNLWRDAITDLGAEHLAPLTNIQWLNLDNTQVSDIGIEYLKDMEKLEFLHLGSTQISDTGLVHLASLKSLKHANLSRTAVTEEGAKILNDKLPDAEIQLVYLGDDSR